MTTRQHAERNAAEMKELLAYLDARPWPDGYEAARVHYDSLGLPIAADIGVEPVDVNGVRAQWLTPPVCEQDRALLFLHGGGFVFGSLVSHGHMAAEMARQARCRVLQLDYRRAPEHPYPAALDDATTAYRWLLERGFAPGHISIAGDSAGGGLVVSMQVNARAKGLPLAGALVCISSWFDLGIQGDSYTSREKADALVQRKVVEEVARHYLNGQDARQPTISPIHADLTGLPPLLIQVGERELLFSDSQAMARKAQAQGVDVTFEEWPDMVHVWHLHFNRLSSGREALQRIGQFVIDKTGARK
ncbi:alpha/beta hydrolase [Corallococcus carmarthensis]|uniref:Alpha/beta hydrolase n=1 Tax=Corallococcus carmarthensis TaxID=2316728 RepID=A0A3A8K5Z0_9BACT|nr:alpha/beta hydrolase [Corallococcus carmarthensis]RKH03490.1 alpha/beta hydrolase [Corallococcus carmarthensis]